MHVFDEKQWGLERAFGKIYDVPVAKDILAFLWFVGIQRGGKNV